jgi:hypothetical protein
MTAVVLLPELIDEIRAIYAADPGEAAGRIETHLTSRLAGVPEGEARRIMENVSRRLKTVPSSRMSSMDSELITKVFGLLIGRKVAPEDLSSTELLERLAQSLNTIFNSLNELISVINMTFSGDSDAGDQTIRQFIGFHLEGGDQTQSLENYLGQINRAFLTTQKAFKIAAQNKVEQILKAIDPESVAAERSGGLKLGPLRKAEDFDILKEKIERIRRWYNNGRFMEDFLREFEKNCQVFGEK